jgi:hypothetical protein
MAPITTVSQTPQTTIDVRIPVVATSVPRGEVTGWAALSTDDDGNPVFDGYGHYIPIYELEKAVHEAFVTTSGKGVVGDMHERQGVGDLVETFVVDDAKRAALGFGEGRQGWAVTAAIRDATSLRDVLDGRKLELSLRGWGRLAPLGNGRSRVYDLALNLAEVVSIVDRGASGNERVSPSIVLIKRAPCGVPADDELKKGQPMMTPEERQAALDALRAAVPEDVFAQVTALLEDAAAAPAEPIAEAAPAEEPAPAPVPDDPEKRELKKRLDTERQTATELAKRVALLEDEAGQRVVLEKVRARMPAVPGIADVELARVLRRAESALDKADYEPLEKCLVAASEAVKASSLLVPHGVSGEGADTSANGQLVALAKRRADTDHTSYHQAFIRVAQENPTLYAQTRAAGASRE